MNEKINICDLIRSKLIENQRSIAWLAQQVGRKSSLGKMLKNNSMQTALLFDICSVLRFDFFRSYSEFLSYSIPTHLNLPNSIEIEYVKLEYENRQRIVIGEMICLKLGENQRSIAWLAKQVGRHRSSFGKVLKKDSIDTKLLFDISITLQFDFFFYYSEILRDPR